jgi:hypothetical protein
MSERIVTKDFKRLKIEEAIKPKNGLTETFLNRYWVVTQDNEILFYRGTSPQCNGDGDIANRLNYKDCTIQFIPAVFVRIRAEDWDIRI